jgi:hypothetical protein
VKGLTLLIVLMLAACGGSSSIDGTYSGPLNDSLIGAGTARVTLASNGASVSGTWGTMYSNPIYNNSGSLSGAISGNSLSMSLTPTNPQACPSVVTATRTGNQIDGTYAAISCSVADSGSINLTKQ